MNEHDDTDAAALAVLEDHLVARSRSRRWRGDPSGYSPGRSVRVTAKLMLQAIQWADARGGADPLSVRRDALRGIEDAEARDRQRWQADKDDGTLRAKQLARQQERRKFYEAKSVKLAYLALHGWDIHDVANTGRVSVERARQMIEDGQRFLEAFRQRRLDADQAKPPRTPA